MLRQRTLRKAVSTTGIGLHTGAPVELCLCPAPAGSGVVFRRIDLRPALSIPAHSRHVGATTLSTSLQRDGQRVSTVEHLLAALAGLGVDNVLVELNAPEVPIMDGSAGPFVDLIQSAGIREQAVPKRFLRVTREVVVEAGDKVASFLPYAGFKIAFTIDFDQPVVRERTTHVEMDFARTSFIDEVSRARTFGFMHEVEGLRSRGLALGGSLDNAVVIAEDRILNRGGLRSEDEFVKHKVLDALGDLSLLGAGLIGEFRAYKSGHSLNNAAVRALLQRRNAWEWVSGADSASAPLAWR
ncbi:MAG: UDP-3-O-[3-hydroxymyristoyl] N-acetylglucosamine deacetylase [Halioglobus sp.]|nr:UDP-3-O-[3-hydroxymyristoyl] N-acetylglucosamine deacetylase [Halioglobus sp.]